MASWRTKNHIREDDPMMAALDLVRVYLAHGPRLLPDSVEVPPTYGEFPETVELLDRRADSFARQSLDLIIELRRVADRGSNKRELSFTALVLLVMVAATAGFLLARLPL